MKFLSILAAALVLSLSFASSDAEAARRLGGGKSTGMQREAVAPQKAATPAQATPQQAAAPAAAPNPAAAGAAQPKRSWLGPVAGLAAGLGLAALASHLGFGQELASMLMIGLLVMAVLVVVGLIMRKRAAAQQPALAAAGGAPAPAPYAPAAFDATPAAGGLAAAPLMPAGTPTGRIPADFDVEGFVRNAKVNFIRLQAANDTGNLDDIRQFTTPEMFGEFKMAIVERGSQPQATTDVVRIDAQVLDVAEEAERYVVSVHFTGLIREDAAPEPFDEIWHLTKPRDGSQGWVLAGIQQLQ